jgi:VWFA-related protein
MLQTPRPSLRPRLLACALCCFCLHAATVRGQETRPTPTPTQEPPAEEQDDETVRISTDLIQTGVMVFDKQGRFVDGLGLDDFELRVDGKPFSVSFFERVTGAAAASGGKSGAASPVPSGVAPPAAAAAGPGRSIIFLVDDLHLSHEGHKRVKDLILRFVEQEMGADDQAVVASSSGKVGFLQQFTDDRAVLRAAAERLRFTRDNSANDRQPPTMTEYEAMLIDRYDPEVTRVFVGEYLRLGLATREDDALMQVRSRSRSILQYAGRITRDTLASLEQVVRRSAQFPGRKIVFLMSDGFLLDTTNTDSSDRLRRVTDAAARANAVVYAFDTRGLDAGMPTGTTSRIFRAKSGERWETQDPLNAVAEETGGKFVRNTNDMRPGVERALEEASRYYLLAWRPDPETKGREKFRRIEVAVRGRPELTVRVQGGYLDEEEPKPAKKRDAAAQAPAPPTPDDQLRAAAMSMRPRQALPTSLSANFIDTPEEGPVLAAALRIDGSAVDYTRAGDGATASVDVVGVIFNADGKREAFFRERLAAAAPSPGQDIFYNYRTRLKPGLYQMRVAARDAKSGLVGSAVQWVEIPDLSARRLALSSLLVADSAAAAAPPPAAPGNAPAVAEAQISVDRAFTRSSRLRYLVFVYNAATGRDGKGAPDVTLQTQIFRGSRLVMAGQAVRLPTDGRDASRLPYAAEITLDSMPAGRYALQVTVEDRVAKSSATRRVNFRIK